METNFFFVSTGAQKFLIGFVLPRILLDSENNYYDVHLGLITQQTLECHGRGRINDIHLLEIIQLTTYYKKKL